MTKEKLRELAERYQKKADAAYDAYQESGITRYDTARRNSEEMADALRMAADAADDHMALVHMRGTVSLLAVEARRAARSGDEDEMRKALRSMVSYAEGCGLIRKEEEV